MAKFRKRPVVVEAVQLRWDTWTKMCEFTGVGKLTDGKPEGCYVDVEGRVTDDCNGRIGLKMLPAGGGGEVAVAVAGDWIIRDADGELYLCREKDFAVTYEDAREMTDGNVLAFAASKKREECTLDNCGHMRQLDAIVDLLGMQRGTRSVLDEVEVAVSKLAGWREVVEAACAFVAEDDAYVAKMRMGQNGLPSWYERLFRAVNELRARGTTAVEAARGREPSNAVDAIMDYDEEVAMVRGLSDPQLREALKNFGCDLTCDACAAIFFTGAVMSEQHKCPKGR